MISVTVQRSFAGLLRFDEICCGLTSRSAIPSLETGPKPLITLQGAPLVYKIAIVIL
jgi:hypothetical protein